MAKVTLTTPATVTTRDRDGTTVYVPTSGQSFSIAEAAGVTTLVSVVAPPVVTKPPTDTMLLAGSLKAITMADGHTTLAITSGGVIQRSGVPIPGGDGSAAVDYVPASNKVWGQDQASRVWWLWGGDMTKPSWSLPAVPYQPGGVAVDPPVVPPVVVPPVVPPVGGSTARTRLLAYLGSIAGKQCLIGQTSHSDNRSEFNAVTQAFGFSPAIMFSDPWLDQWAGNAPFNDGFMPIALAHAKSGGIVGMSMILPNPVDHGPSQGGPAVDPVQLLTPGSALNMSLNGLLDQAAALLQQFKDAGNAVLTRFLLELDGGWFWWGYGHFSHAQQTQLFRYIVNYLRVTKGLDNLLTTFAINGGPGDYEYPGDDVVDIVGIDGYTDNLAAVYKGAYDKLIAQAPTKLFALTEDGSGDPNGPDRTYDQNRLKTDIQSALPLAVYANFWSGWGPDMDTNGKAAMSDPFWINKAQVRI